MACINSRSLGAPGSSSGAVVGTRAGESASRSGSAPFLGRFKMLFLSLGCGASCAFGRASAPGYADVVGTNALVQPIRTTNHFENSISTGGNVLDAIAISKVLSKSENGSLSDLA